MWTLDLVAHLRAPKKNKRILMIRISYDSNGVKSVLWEVIEMSVKE